MYNDLAVQEQELRLQEKYPIGTRGRLRYKTSITFYLAMGWTPDAIAVVEAAYISKGIGNECLTVRLENGRVEPLRCYPTEFEVLEGDRNED